MPLVGESDEDRFLHLGGNVYVMSYGYQEHINIMKTTNGLT